VNVGDREQVLEDPLEADVLALMSGGIRLQERFERLRLDVEEMGHFHPLLELSERNLLNRFRHCSPAHRRENGHIPAGLAIVAGGRGCSTAEMKCEAL
jgi:hypothetical protein